ncbi:MAG TPA: fibronectin type III domain-containing protein [Chloroflexota bacterium]|nr:fibronectin type III domain-containing protein [Chloroflexota bacterium]
MTSNITVFLGAGTYRLSQPLRFGPEDSGSNGFRVAWAAAPGATPIVSGARRIVGWRLQNASKDIWAAPVPPGFHTRQLYVNGMRATLTSGAVPTQLMETPAGYTAATAAMAHWRNPSGVDFVFAKQGGAMAEPMCPIAAITGREIRMAQPCWDNSTRRACPTMRVGMLVAPTTVPCWRDPALRQVNEVGYGTLSEPTYVENAFELLGKPGQFYLDIARHRLYYTPRTGQLMSTADVEAPVLETLLSGHGSPGNPVRNIVFSGVQFSYATWLQPGSPEGFSELQMNVTLTGKGAYKRQGLCHLVTGGTCPYGAWSMEPGSVQWSDDRRIWFLDDRFVHLGGAGLQLDNGTHNVTVSGSVFTDISGNGIEVGNVDMPEAKPPLQTSGVSIDDNHLYGLPVEYLGGEPIFVGYASHTTITHNQIDHVPYGGISLDWGGWLDKIPEAALANFSRDNVVSDNLIYDFMEILGDGGGVYTVGRTGTSMGNGLKILGNVIFGGQNWARAIQSDDGTSFVTVAGNAMYDNNYDWGAPQPNLVTHHGDNPELIEHNYWQQGAPTLPHPNVGFSGNVLITGPSRVPHSVLVNAGVQPAYAGVQWWRPAGNLVPNAPQSVRTRYAYNGRVWLNWLPSFAEGNSPVTSYVVTTCRARLRAVSPQAPSFRTGCRHPVASMSVSTANYERYGYAVVRGLSPALSYRFVVTAVNAAGSSTPSVPSGATSPDNRPVLPPAPMDFAVQPGRGLVRVLWYSPFPARTGPALGYIVTVSNGQRYTVTGLSQFLMSETGGQVSHVFGGLTPGRSYTFSIAAVNPAGQGPPAISAPVTPTN